jgi:hypothetical protein
MLLVLNILRMEHQSIAAAPEVSKAAAAGASTAAAPGAAAAAVACDQEGTTGNATNWCLLLLSMVFSSQTFCWLLFLSLS